MGCTSECGSGYHDRCNLVWCDCGCHHALIDAHHAGAHEACVRDCQECRRTSHQKVYSGEYFATLIPQWHWICADCKATGTDSIPSEIPPPLDMPRFLDLLADIDPAGAASMRRLLVKVAERRALRPKEKLTDAETLDIVSRVADTVLVLTPKTKRPTK